MPIKPANAKSTGTPKQAPSRASAATPDAVALLTSDHREVKQMFAAYKKLVAGEADGEERQALAEQICTALTVHATCEEEIFYPAARSVLKEQDLLDEAEVEHAGAKDLIAQIQAMQPDEDLYDAKVTVLGEYIDHHVKEEEGEMFPKIKKTDLDLDDLGTQIAERKVELTAELETQGKS